MRPLSHTPNRTEQVYAAIRDSICDCTLEPGSHLVQEDIAATLGVSRQPVQQAMLLLKNDGLVVEHGGRGLYVAPLDPEAIRHHYQIRQVLDQLATKLVAKRAADSAECRATLRAGGDAILAAGEKAQGSGNAVEAVNEDVRFHEFLYEMSGNPFIAQTAAPHWNFLRRVMVAVLLQAGRGERVWQEHRRILDALVGGDAKAAERIMTEHIEGANDALIAKIGHRETTGAVTQSRARLRQ